jgi:hypothetical protein
MGFLRTPFPSSLNITDESLGFGLVAGIWLQDGSDWSLGGDKMEDVGLFGKGQGYKTSGSVKGREVNGFDARIGEEVLSTHNPGHLSIDVKGTHPPNRNIQNIGKGESVIVPLKTSLTVTLSVDVPILGTVVPDKVVRKRSRKVPNLQAPDGPTLLAMVSQKDADEREEEKARYESIHKRPTRPLSTTSTYASHAKKFVNYRTTHGILLNGELDLFMVNMTYGERLEVWLGYIYSLSDQGLYGQALASHLSATKAFILTNHTSMDMSFCDDNIKAIKDAKFKANSVDRSVRRVAALKRDSRLKLPVFEELTDVVYEMAFREEDDWGWVGMHIKGAATAQLLQTLLGTRISSTVKRQLTDHHLDTEDVVLKFEKLSLEPGGSLLEAVYTCGDIWPEGFLPCHVTGVELRSNTEKGKVTDRNRFIGRVDDQSNKVCLAVALWAKHSGARIGEPFFTMRRISPITKRLHVCYINDTHVNFVVKDAADALGLGRDHYSTHSARSGFVTKHTWAERLAVGKSVPVGFIPTTDADIAQAGGWADPSKKGAMKMHYDRSTSVYRPLDPQYALSREDVIGMLSLVEQGNLPKLSTRELYELRHFRRSVWGT